MKAFQTYLNFDGDTREAMTFYQRCLGAELSVQTFADAKMEGPPGTGDRVLHARLTSGAATLMASDTMPGMPFTPGNNFAVNIDCSSAEEVDRFFAALGEGGRVTMPLQDTFWGARFGMLVDRFGVAWMFNFEKPKQR